MSRVLLFVVLAPLVASASEVAVVEDTNGAIHQALSGFGVPGAFCRETSKKFLQKWPDHFDGLVTFTTRQLSDFQHAPQGWTVKNSVTGTGQRITDESAAFGSKSGKLSQCVFMGQLGRLPVDPDGPVMMPAQGDTGITGVELVAHEYGHHWMLWLDYDLGDGAGPRDLLRGRLNDSSTNHYSKFVNAGSPMYGNFVTDLGNGAFQLSGGNRKFNELDQYLMGLRDASEVSPIFFVKDNANADSADYPLPKGKTQMVYGTRVDVGIDDIIRAMGPRNPSAAQSQKCWRVAFVLVHDPGNPPTAAQLQQVDAYRDRFSKWFGPATDMRGEVDTRLLTVGCKGPNTTPPDAGTPGEELDAGSPATDAGMTQSHDAGSMVGPDPVLPQQPADAGSLTPDMGYLDESGCGCTTSAAGFWSALLAAWIGATIFVRRRERARR